MKHLSTAFALIIAGAAQAQCTFTPTITPDPAMICPGSVLSLETQAYDSYQWFENGQPITDQTAQSLQVNNASAGHSFTVECTLDGCTEMSAPVVLDPLSFPPPTVTRTGGWPITFFQGAYWYCMGPEVLLILEPPYDTNIQWKRNGVVIPGETNDTLVVTTDGSYRASGAPAQCPGYVQQLGASIALHFQSPDMPTITVVGDQLCAGGGGMPWQYQWYLNGESIGNGPCITPTIAGSYTVTGPGSKNVCGTAPSEPYEWVPTGMADHTAAPELLVRPNPASTEVTIASSLPLNGPWRLMDAAGREVRNGRFNGCTNFALDLSTVEAGNYLMEMQMDGERIVRKVVKE
jgi:hypothetical protein